MPNSKLTNKKNLNDRAVTTTAATLIAQIEAAKTIADLKAVLVELVKRSGLK